MWTSPKDAKLKFGRGLLGKMALVYSKAPKKLQPFLPEWPDKVVRDSHGIQGFVSETHLFVAKKSPYGDIVSVDKVYWERCKTTGRKIIMYIETNEAFYEFDVAAITDTQENMRGDIPMTNFSIRHGVNVFTTAEVKAGVKPSGKHSKVEDNAERLRMWDEHVCTCATCKAGKTTHGV